MKYVSLCSGVEAATQAWEPLGWEPVAFSEIEPFPCAVLASRFPRVPNLGDMARIHYDRKTNELHNDTTRIVCPGGIDLVVGGTPCQSFSVAGKREGLEGASGLAFHYARLIGEIRPRWFVWENVPGALSSVTHGDQRDFNFLLHAFAVGGDASLGCRYDLCWRVVDTQYVRVERFPLAIPQRRRRVFVVGRLATDGGGGCEVLLEQEGVRGNPPPRRVKGQGFAGDSARRARTADDAKCWGVNAENGSFMFPFSEEVGQTNAVGHLNGVVECLTPSGEHPQTHRVYGTGGAYPTLQANSGAVGCGVLLPVGADVYNHELTGAVAATFGRNSGGANNAGPKVMEAIPVALRGNRRAGEEGKLAETDGKGAAYSLTHVQTDSMVCTADAVAIGIGRDAFNSGANAKMSQSVSHQVQPPITAKGPGAVCATVIEGN